MPKRKPIDMTTELEHRQMPALTQEGQENRCISMAYDLVERRLLDGSASSQETTFFLKLGTEKEKAETEKLKLELDLVKAKTEQLKAQKSSEEMFTKAIKAMQVYSGSLGNDYFDEGEENEGDY